MSPLPAPPDEDVVATPGVFEVNDRIAYRFWDDTLNRVVEQTGVVKEVHTDAEIRLDNGDVETKPITDHKDRKTGEPQNPTRRRYLVRWDTGGTALLLGSQLEAE